MLPRACKSKTQGAQRCRSETPARAPRLSRRGRVLHRALCLIQQAVAYNIRAEQHVVMCACVCVSPSTGRSSLHKAACAASSWALLTRRAVAYVMPSHVKSNAGISRRTQSTSCLSTQVVVTG